MFSLCTPGDLRRTEVRARGSDHRGGAVIASTRAPPSTHSDPSASLRTALGAALAALLLLGPAGAGAQEHNDAPAAEDRSRDAGDRLAPAFGDGPAVWGKVAVMDGLAAERTAGSRTVLWPALAPEPAPTPPGALYGTPWAWDASPLRFGTDAGQPGEPFAWEGTPLRFITVEMPRKSRR